MSEKLEVGSIVEGKIVRIKPFGAIVSLGSVQGLVHISQVANKIALSIRDALPKEERQPRNERPFRKPNNQTQKPASPAEEYFRPQSANGSSDFEDKMKEWAKQSNERHTSLNKRANKRSY